MKGRFCTEVDFVLLYSNKNKNYYYFLTAKQRYIFFDHVPLFFPFQVPERKKIVTPIFFGRYDNTMSNHVIFVMEREITM